MTLITSMVTIVALGGTLGAEPIAGWRGDGSGVFLNQNPPTHWSKDENVIWMAKMPDRSNAQPVVVGSRIFVCSEPFELMCLRLSDGQALWKRSNSYREVTNPELWSAIETELSAAREIRDRKASIQAKLEELRQRRSTAPDDAHVTKSIEQAEKKIAVLDTELSMLSLSKQYTLPITQRLYNGYTTATPTSDGEHVWAVFGNQVVICYDMEGNRRWATVLPDVPQAMWGHSTSPLLVEDKLIVCIDAIVALDAETGKEIWRTKHGQSWGSPVSVRIGDETVIFMANGRMLRASDGNQVFREDSPLERASPVVFNHALYYVGLGGVAYDFPTKVGDTLKLTERWRAETRGGLYAASPVVYDGLVYAVSSKHILNVLDAANGKMVYIKRLDLGREPTWPSLCVAGNYLYVTNRDGTTLVLATGRTYKELGRNQLEFVISSPVFYDNRMFLRTNVHLYCVGATNSIDNN
jgi:hypothetical protein